MTILEKDISTGAGAPTKLWNKSFIMIMLLGILTQSGSLMVTTLISKYAINLGAELTIAATISSILSIVALLCRPFSGIIADRLNRKMIMLVSTAVTAACVLGYALIPSVGSLVFFRVIHGAAFAFMSVANIAFGTAFIPDKYMGEGMAYLGIGNVLAQAVGPSIGLELSNLYGYDTVFYITAGAMIVGFLLILLIPYKHVPRETTGKRERITLNSIIEPKVILFALILMLFSCGNGLMNTYAALLGEERGLDQIALFFTAYSLSTLACRPFAGKLLDKKGISYIIIPSIILSSIAMCFVAAANATWMVVVAGILKAAGQGSAVSAVQATSVKMLGRQRAGVISSTCYIGQDIGNAFAPIFGSFIVTNAGYGTLFYSYAGLLFTAGLALYALYLFTTGKNRTEKAN